MLSRWQIPKDLAPLEVENLEDLMRHLFAESNAVMRHFSAFNCLIEQVQNKARALGFDFPVPLARISPDLSSLGYELNPVDPNDRKGKGRMYRKKKTPSDEASSNGDSPPEGESDHSDDGSDDNDAGA